jgi:hypothetical protein
MARSSKESWLQGPGDLQEADVEDVPAPGMSVRVRGLPARYSAEVQSQLKIEQEGREQVARVDIAAMEALQFQHGVIDPVFTKEEVQRIQESHGPVFRKVIAKIDELSGIDKEAIAEVEQRFPAGGAVEGGPALGDAVANGSAGPDVPARVGA